MEKSLSTNFAEEINKTLQKGTTTFAQYPGQKFVDVEFVKDVIKAKLDDMVNHVENYTAKEYMDNEFDYPMAKKFSSKNIETICHFAECFAKYYNFNLK